MTRRALVVYQHAPTPGAPGIYRHRMLLSGLVEHGWEVDLVSTPVNYMTGVADARYRGKPYVREVIDGVVHHWVWASSAIHRSRTHRLANYTTFAATALVRAATLRRPDVIVVSTPPLSVAALGPVLAARFRRPWLMEVRDPWPDAAAVAGWLAEGSSLWRWVERVDRSLTVRASALIVPTPGLVARELRVGAHLVGVIPGAVVGAPAGGSARVARRAQLGIAPETCLFVYTGAVGVVNGLDVLLDAVARVDPGLDFGVAIAGDGSARRELERRITAEGDRRVRFLGAVSKPEIREWLGAADVCLHLLRPDPRLECALPSKVLEYFAARRPFVTTAAGLPQRLAEASGGSFAPDAAALAGEIERWATMSPNERADRGDASFRFGSRVFGREVVVLRLATFLETVAAGLSRRTQPAATDYCLLNSRML